MPAAARIGDRTTHLPTVPAGVPGASVAGNAIPPTGALTAPGMPTVLIEGQPAAVIGTVNACGMHPQLGPGNVTIPRPGPASGLVLIGGRPAAKQGDQTTCGAVISTGARAVFIGGL
ncbi:PAAR domain-containing protein [Amycolatopsis anabasis]|uniref:PAAR domain-containing protein n=1 Tax=Amycolatopsis anabasis TaxID=1840409 RepID=UPI00131BDC8A|nr:PAAR domain-containing protein [Amycolatopsis anabasis]